MIKTQSMEAQMKEDTLLDHLNQVSRQLVTCYTNLLELQPYDISMSMQTLD